jgi:hypothetical protein
MISKNAVYTAYDMLTATQSIGPIPHLTDPFGWPVRLGHTPEQMESRNARRLGVV